VRIAALLAFAGIGLAAGQASGFGAGFGDREHEPITEDALGDFLRAGVFDDVVDEHADFADDDEAANVKWVHADGCNFGETFQQINAFYDDAVINLDPHGGNFDPWSATDDFGRIFHPVQDFYSHSNWVELGFPAQDDPNTEAVEISAADLIDFSTSRAVPPGLGEWGIPQWRPDLPPIGSALAVGDFLELPETIRGDIVVADLVDVPLADVDHVRALDIADANQDGSHDANDATSRFFPPEWRFGLLPHPTILGDAGFVPAVDTDGVAMFETIEPFGDSASFPVPIMTSGHELRLLISGVGGRPVTDIIGNQCDPFQRDGSGELLIPLEINSCTPPLAEMCTPDGQDPNCSDAKIEQCAEQGLGCSFETDVDDYTCIAYYGSRFALTHSGSARSELNKDRESSAPTRFPKARALAYLQTQYEWCRFVKQAGDAGADGPLLSLWVRDRSGSAVANPLGTPCGPDDGKGRMGVKVTIDDVNLLDPGALNLVNLSLALYDDPSRFHRLAKSHAGPSIVGDSGELPGAPGPLSQCVGTSDGSFRVALHGWGEDLVGLPNGDFNQSEDALIGFSETLLASAIPLGATVHRTSNSGDLQVAYHVERALDSEGDGLDACGEDFYGTDPADSDSEDDGLSDGAETFGTNPTDPLVADSDGDGLNDGQEDTNKNGSFDAGETNPNDSDTDDDLVGDGVEVNGSNPTNPLDPDSDDDGLRDGQEDANRNGALDAGETNPNDADSDDDGLSDGQEVGVGTNPLNPDTDGDGLLDGRDVDWIEDAVRALPDSALKSPAAGNRNAMLNLLADAEAHLLRGRVKPARDKLTTLRSKIDGCGTTSDTNDWVTDCAAQVRIRQLLDILIGNL
jgi:hypothetical protein